MNATAPPARLKTRYVEEIRPDLISRFGRPSYIKIDVEGQEAAVLRGGRKTLEKFSPILFLALHNEMTTAEGGDPNLALNELAQLKYETFAINGNSLGRDGILQRPLLRIVAARVLGR